MNSSPQPVRQNFQCGGLIAAAVLTLVAVSCGSSKDSARWMALAEGFVPSVVISKSMTWEVPFMGGAAPRLIPDAGGSGAWVESILRTEDWEQVPSVSSVWRARRPIQNVGLPAQDGMPPERLVSAAGAFDLLPIPKAMLEENVETNSFTSVQAYVYLKTAGERPPEARYSAYVERGKSVEGRWRVGLERYTCDGFPLWSGHTEELVVDVAENSVLSLGFAGLALPEELGQSAGTVILRVGLDGKQIFRLEQSVGDVARADRHRIVLPPEARASARLSFAVEGPAAICAVLDPILGPADIGTPGSRPFLSAGEADPQSVMLVVADTFRADNMSVYGGEFERSLTPNLDRFADTSLLFTRAWSPSSWTLPAMASMMTGLYPHQHGADRSKRRIDNGINTLAERFASAGYRTAAITDSVLVSKRFGFDQGFQWFDESENWSFKTEGLNNTIEEVGHFLDSDDGRPWFLFVQSYRVHGPYFASEQTRSEYADVLSIDDEWKTLRRRLVIETGSLDPDAPVKPGLADVARRLEQLYRGGVVDFDRGFGRLLDDFDRRGLNHSAWVVFTSDHGDAFGEHKRMFHGNGVWESHVRIPLFIRGPDQTHRRVETAATLVDLPQTLAAMCGLSPDLRWGGRNLLDEDSRGAVFSFECPGNGKSGMAAIIDGSRKVIFENTDAGIEGRVILSAYDLDADSREERDVVLEDADWPAQLLERHGSELLGLRRPLFTAPHARLRPQDIADLAAVGYVDD